MKKLLLRTLMACSVLGISPVSAQAPAGHPVAIAIHGGAGTINKDNMSAEKEREYRSKLEQAVKAGHAVLAAGGSSLDAVVEAVQVMEQSELFNAGKGAVYTFDGEHELDASIMWGKNRQAGAVAGVKTIKSPIALARAVMVHSDHVMLSGRGAEAYAATLELDTVSNDYFDSKARLEQLHKAKATMKLDKTAQLDPLALDYKFGTVGAVALDKEGNLAAATSTGGMTAKRWGRIGDSPVIGAGTFADNQSCAVSATGHGEYFIRFNVAADICARVAYQNVSAQQAADEVIHNVLKPAGGTGGVIVMDAQGNISQPFNTQGMYRASIDTSGELKVGIYGHSQ
ncbi:isoaspartyl peptidase/L-asparaginase [Lacimicrobium sp. SS2-24]|uniref:isoaspartyl peptidase/L-asparaginase family protein n=1 Tax=Lacimicrobium sp. SS2-24 TaxID=2005569 RepID=UPI000B4BBDF0|nr:isoaspartyl peptidase/L-asparaginase [Lacimicrobium sp. SS2-24]